MTKHKLHFNGSKEKKKIIQCKTKVVRISPILLVPSLKYGQWQNMKNATIFNVSIDNFKF